MHRDNKLYINQYFRYEYSREGWTYHGKGIWGDGINAFGFDYIYN